MDVNNEVKKLNDWLISNKLTLNTTMSSSDPTERKFKIFP